jgi:ketosteroid isomerase-like protein
MESLNLHGNIATVMIDELTNNKGDTIMKKLFIALIGLLVITGTFIQTAMATEQEVKKTIMDDNAYVKKNLKGLEGTYSNEGAIEFWSSGGLIQTIKADGRLEEYDAFNIDVKHIQVTILVPDKIALAHYYSEGSMTPKGSPAVANYRTRVSQVYTKEAGKWKVRSSHWSPIIGGSGTSQTALVE